MSPKAIYFLPLELRTLNVIIYIYFKILNKRPGENYNKLMRNWNWYGLSNILTCFYNSKLNLFFFFFLFRKNSILEVTDDYLKSLLNVFMYYKRLILRGFQVSRKKNAPKNDSFHFKFLIITFENKKYRRKNSYQILDIIKNISCPFWLNHFINVIFFYQIALGMSNSVTRSLPF